MREFSVTRCTFSARDFYRSRSKMLLFQPLLIQHFSSSVYLGNLHPSSSSASWSTNTRHLSIRPAKDFYVWIYAEALSCNWRYFESTSRNCLALWTSAEALCRDSQHFQSTPRYCVYCITLWTVTFRHLSCCNCNTALWYVTTHLSQKHYHILSICRELNFFYYQIPTPRVYFTSPLLYRKLLLPTSIHLTSG